MPQCTTRAKPMITCGFDNASHHECCTNRSGYSRETNYFCLPIFLFFLFRLFEPLVAFKETEKIIRDNTELKYLPKN
jgi:hypothetical protein